MSSLAADSAQVHSQEACATGERQLWPPLSTSAPRLSLWNPANTDHRAPYCAIQFLASYETYVWLPDPSVIECE